MSFQYCLIALAAHMVLIRCEWIEPNAWGRAELQEKPPQIGGTELCPRCQICDSNNHDPSKPMSDAQRIEENVSFVYYRKLISSLFDRKNLNFDDDSGLYSRTLVFTITADQLDSLEYSSDPRDLDIVVSKILQKNKHTPSYYKQNSQIPSVFSYIKKLWSYPTLSREVNFILLALVVILTVIYLHRRYNYSIIFIILAGFFLVGFIYSYLDCNRKLQIEEMGELLYANDDPCSEKLSTGWLGLFNFGSNKASISQCMEHLKKKHRVKWNYCRPDEVLLSYINEITLDQFRMIIDKCTGILKVCTEKYTFPYNIIAMLIFASTLTTFLSLTFKYILSPKVWAKYATEKNSEPKESHVSAKDRISGENLSVLLGCFQHSVSQNDVQKAQGKPAVSGVEILETIQNDEKNKVGEKEEYSEDQLSTHSQIEAITDSLESNGSEKLKKK